MPEHQSTTSADLWKAFKEGLYQFLRRRLPTEMDAEDVLQEVFLRIHEGAAQLEYQDRVHAWVYGIARRAVADFYRTRERRAPLAVATDSEEVPETPDARPSENLSAFAGSHDVHEEVLSWLRPMIDELPEMYRLPLQMADVEGRTQQEVADALGLSLSGAKSRVQRGRVLLGEMLKRCCEVEFGEEGRAVAFRRLHPPDSACEDACE